MSRRTVAEVLYLGLHSHPEAPYTPDDMLAWLDAEGFSAEMSSARNEGDRDIYVRLGQYGSMWESVDYDGPTLHATLHATLEAAVLAVAEREEPGNE